MSQTTRTDKDFKNLASFAREIFVVCPHCEKQAVILADPGPYTVPYPENAKAHFRCSHCMNPIDETKWHGPVILEPASANCGFCGVSIQYSKTTTKIPNSISVKCSQCEKEKKYGVKFTRTYAGNQQATDPYFGLQLWLQIPVDENILWAYNFEHLAYLKTYVSAKLREAASGGKHALAWKLPNFIKVAKNRDKILKGIERLEGGSFTTKNTKE